MKKAYLQNGNMHTGIMIKEVKIHEDKNPLHITPLLHSDNLNGPGTADEVVMGADMEGCPELIDCLAGKVHGVSLDYAGFPPHTIIKNIRLRSAMAILLNGIIFTDQTILLNVSTQDIYSVELLEGPKYLAIYGPKAAGGLVVITLRNGTEKDLVSIQPGLTTYTFKGFYKAREFFLPKYDAKAQAISASGSHTTVFWKPVLLTDKNGDASFDLNNVAIGNYRLVAEGICANGSFARAILNYQAK